MARVTILAMHRDSLITLPPPRGERGRPKPVVFGPDTEPPLFPPPTALDDVRPLDLRTVVHSTREGELWNEFVARHHYLDHKTLVGAQMRYAVHDRDGWRLAMLGFRTAAWKLAPRDAFIGWTPQKREKNLPLVVDNPRFLILPRITTPTSARTSSLSSAAACPRTGRSATAPPPSSSRPSSRHRASPAPSTEPPAGPMSEPRGGEGATTATSSATSQKRTSGSAPCDGIGGERSIARIPRPANAYAERIRPLAVLNGLEFLSRCLLGVYFGWCHLRMVPVYLADH